MAQKRYAIVRVDEGCQLSDINIGNRNACRASKSCQNCLIGDTKEQLIRKVATAIRKSQVSMFYNNSKGWVVDKLAKEIVEFLGVE